MKTSILILIGFLTVAKTASGQFAINWHSIDGGGGTSAGGAFRLAGTIGQPDAGTMSGGMFVLTGGYWSLINEGQPPSAPRLYVIQTNSVVRILWERSVEGWILQESASFNDDGAPWEDVSEDVYEANSTHWYFDIPELSDRKFFRLYNP